MKKYFIVGFILLTFIVAPVMIQAEQTSTERQKIESLQAILASLQALLNQLLANLANNKYPVVGEITTDQNLSFDINNWITYTDAQYGFEFKYPATWATTDSQGAGYRVIVMVVNPSRAGKPDTDVPIEQLSVRSQNLTCEGQAINLGGKTGTSRGWEQGFGLIYYRDLCFKTQGWPITISLSAFDYSSQAVMNKILSTFKFTIDAGNQIRKDNWGITFMKGSDWKVVNNSDTRVDLEKISGNWQGDKIDITYVADGGSYISVLDNRFGSVSYEYDTVIHEWMETSTEMTGASSLASAIPITDVMHSDSVFPFAGRGHWLPYVIPLRSKVTATSRGTGYKLNHSYLKLNITGSGDTQALKDLVETIERLKG